MYKLLLASALALASVPLLAHGQKRDYSREEVAVAVQKMRERFATLGHSPEQIEQLQSWTSETAVWVKLVGAGKTLYYECDWHEHENAMGCHRKKTAQEPEVTHDEL